MTMVLTLDLSLSAVKRCLDNYGLISKMYSQVLTDVGVLILEDIQSYDWINTLIANVPDSLKQFVTVYDLREKKGRYDDILLVIKKK